MFEGSERVRSLGLGAQGVKSLRFHHTAGTEKRSLFLGGPHLGKLLTHA